MSNSFGIATVTACLQNVLQNAFLAANNSNNEALPHPQVTTIIPSSDTTQTDGGLPAVGANIFLFQVTPNAALRNNDVPTRNSNGDVISRPRLALDLHYLITFYGDDTKYEPQRLLGLASSILHRQPVLSPGLVTQTITSLLPTLPIIAKSNLAAAMEPVRVTPTGLSAEELARIWSVFSFQTRFALSMSYQASPLFVDADDVGKTALPVTLPPNVYIDVAGPPEVDQVVVQSDATAPITAGAPVFIIGSGFGNGEGVQVVIDGVEVTPGPAAADVTPTQIAVTLPATLLAGIHALQVARPRLMGTPPAPHQGLLSDPFAFTLPPVIGPGPVTTDSTVNSGGLVSGNLNIPVQPNVGQRQTVAVFLNEVTAGGTSQSYTFPLDARPTSGPPDSPTIVVPFHGVAPSTYLVRVQIDGATSALTTVAGQFAQPTVVVGP